MPLNDKQIRFCEEYAIDFNGTQAAIRAGYSKKTARSQASDLLTKPDIQNKIKALMNKAANKLEVTREMVMDGYRKLAFYDARNFYDKKGNLIQVPDLDDETSFALAGFEVMEEVGGNGKGRQVVLGYTKKIKMAERRQAMDSICRLMGWNAPEKVDHTTKGESINDNSGIELLSKEERLQLLRLKQKMRANEE